MTWVLLRAAGIASYVMLFASVAWGLASTSNLFGRKVSRAAGISVHRYVSTVALVLLAVHLGGLLVDRAVPFGPGDLLVPFRSEYRAAAVALGIFALYATVLVVASSVAKSRIGSRWWRRLHALAVPAFAASMLHGVLAGTDAAEPWLWPVYVATGLVVVFLLLFRAMTIRPRRSQPNVPETAGRSALAGAGPSA